ncbi:MAG TPA: hypothetical protein DCQ31_18805, partial [Bacteroidales bacterium]|nr:hypothetical protein [Bacteroidales bacterium]
KGSGATGVAIIRNGMVDQIVMTNQGSGYVGKNRAKQDFSLVPTGTAGATFNVFGAKTYMRDINLGTGKRTIED